MPLISDVATLTAVTAPASRWAPADPSLPLTPRERARSLARRPDLWRPLVQFTEPRFHLRLATGPDWEAWLLTWLPGQSTGLHDHGGSAGAFAVLAGSVDEELIVRSPSGPPGSTRSTTRRYGAGQVRAFGTHHLHDVVAGSGRPAVTLHVYSPRLTAMTRYTLADGELTVTGREREGADW